MKDSAKLAILKSAWVSIPKKITLKGHLANSVDLTIDERWDITLFRQTCRDSYDRDIAIQAFDFISGLFLFRSQIDGSAHKAYIFMSEIL